MMLHEKYRPSTWSEVVGQDRIIAKLQAKAQRGDLAGKAYWISGASGVGKSSIARLIALEVADDFSMIEVDATGLSPADVEELERGWQIRGWGEKGGRAYIVNEAHGLRKQTIRKLLTVLERIPRHVVIIFTTTVEGQTKPFRGLRRRGPTAVALLSGRLGATRLGQAVRRARQANRGERKYGWQTHRALREVVANPSQQSSRGTIRDRGG